MKSRVPAPARQAAAVQRRAQAEPGARAGSRAPSLHVVGGGLDGAVLVRLQATAGNQAVGQLLSAGPPQGAGSRLSVQAQACSHMALSDNRAWIACRLTIWSAKCRDATLNWWL